MLFFLLINVKMPTIVGILTFMSRKISCSARGGRVARWCWVNFQCRGVLLIWIIVGQGPTALAVGAGGGCLDIFLSSIVSLFFLPLSGRRPDID